MAKPFIADEFRAVIAPLPPPVLKSGIPWEMLPAEMGCGSGMTCWLRFRDWQKAGVWQPPKYSDKAYDFPHCRQAYCRPRITLCIA